MTLVEVHLLTCLFHFFVRNAVISLVMLYIVTPADMHRSSLGPRNFIVRKFNLLDATLGANQTGDVEEYRIMFSAFLLLDSVILQGPLRFTAF